MNNQNAVTLVTKQPIPASDVERPDFSRNHKSLNFSELLPKFSSYLENTDYFLHREGITFRDHVGRQLMTGNELLYYPELAKKVREIADYPMLKRSHKVDKTINGLGFLRYFYQYADMQFKNFEVELEQLSKQVDELIDLYGQERYLPLINNIEFARTPKCNGSYSIAIGSQAIIINNVKWPVSNKKWEEPKNCLRETDYLNLHRFLNISYEIKYIYLENFIADTPFIQVRIVKTSEHKGHTAWYNLDTRQPASKAEAIDWKKTL